MLRYIGDTPLGNQTWRLHNANGPTNWYLARYDLTPRGYCVFVWPDTGTEKWNIPCGMLDVPRAQVGALLRRLTSVSTRIQGGRDERPGNHHGIHRMER